MGLLDNILSAVDNRKRVLKRNLFDFFDDPNGTAQVWADRASEDRYGGAEERQAAVNKIKGKPYDKQALARADQRQQQSALDQAMGAITVWHGSPHKFDKFDMSKIGTGEGAQAYGHGLYMAEKPGVAASYKTFDPREWWIGDQKIDPKSLKGADKQAWNVATLAKTNNQDPMEYAAKLMNEGKMSLAQYGRVSKFSNAELRDPTGGNMYKVDIPDEAVARFLDWDKPLSQQAPEVREAVAPWVKQYGLPMQEEGSSLYSVVKELEAIKNGAGSGSSPAAFKAMAPQASEALKKAGIPGIRYLDGGSRGQQAGTSNFVLFDDQMPRILEVNGNPTGLQPWGKSEWKGLLE